MTLLVMAAGLGSRYGGLKQIDPIGPNGEFILDYTVYDAVRAGFDRVVFVIKEENLQAFEETVGSRIRSRIGNNIAVAYAFQDLHDLPEGFAVPEGRTKQWGTAHAVLAARDLLKDGFAVVNADDLYGPEALQLLHDFLAEEQKDVCGCMVGFVLRNTMTEHGTVSRGVCVCDENGFLTDIQERTEIGMQPDGEAAYREDGVWHPVDAGCIVSMNAWALDGGFIESAQEGFADFLRNMKNPQKEEYYLPTAVWNYSRSCGKPLRVLRTNGRWYGVTYREDRQPLVDYIQKQIETGVYPS